MKRWVAGLVVAILLLTGIGVFSDIDVVNAYSVWVQNFPDELDVHVDNWPRLQRGSVVVTGVRAWNNNLISNSDYKLKEKDLERVLDKAKIFAHADIVEMFTENEDIKNNLTKDYRLNYLIENDVLHRDSQVRITGNNIGTTIDVDKYSRVLDTGSKTELLVGLMKSYYGVQPHRSVLYRAEPHRVWMDGEVKTLSELFMPIESTPIRSLVENMDRNLSNIKVDYASFGDYYIYMNPNVYELYLEQAYRQGIIGLSDLTDVVLLRTLRDGYRSDNSFTNIVPRYSSAGSPMYPAGFSTGMAFRDDHMRYYDYTFRDYFSSPETYYQNRNVPRNPDPNTPDWGYDATTGIKSSFIDSFIKNRTFLAYENIVTSKPAEGEETEHYWKTV